MMTKNKTSKLFALKVLAIAPAAAVLVALFGCEQRQSNAQKPEASVQQLFSSDSVGVLSSDTVAIATGGTVLTPLSTEENSKADGKSGGTVTITLKTGEVITLTDAKENPISEQISALHLSADEIQSVEVIKK
ncbi:MAG: hypothetical protein LBO71_06940 [Prevotellaceae bacterium]|nr:hypothetical protein [Prevotellaceae bacterium]